MTTFNFVIICLFVCSMVYRFVRAIDRNEIGKACISGAEILMFAYLAKVLMYGGNINEHLPEEIH